MRSFIAFNAGKDTRLLTTLSLVAVILLLAGGPAATVALAADVPDPGPPVVATLRPGQHVFWAGPYVERVTGPLVFTEAAYRGAVADARCTPDVSCFDYALHVAKPAARLRVAADGPFHEARPVIDLAVTAPDGSRTFSTWLYDGTAAPLTQEVFIDAPATGRYTVRLYILYAENASFELRAKLEKGLKPTPTTEEWPDLRSEPPLGFTWETPLGTSCRPEETVAGASRCLRFTFGWQNVGRGKLDIVFDRAAPTAAALSGPVVQRIYSSDGSYRDNPGAGGYQYHPAHNHFHYREFFTGQLLRVVNADAGALEPAGAVRKIGACSHDWKMAEWERFVQAQQGGDSGSHCGRDPIGVPIQTRIAVSAGWVDHYPSGNTDNFVDFGDNPDGDYVVRVVMDPEQLLLEEDEANNVGYAHIRVEGERITLIERGQGADPWDAAKRVMPLEA